MRAWRGHALQMDLGRHAAAWDALNRTRFDSHPLLDSRFWNALLRHFRRPGVMLWELREGETVLAMCLLQRAGWGRWESYLPGQAQLGPVMIHDPDMVDELLPALRPMALQLDLLCVDPDVCRLMPSPGRRVRVAPHALTMNVRTEGSFDDYWERRPTALRQNLRRYERLAEKDGVSFSHRVIDQAGAMADGVARYAALECQGWKGAEGTALAPGNEQTRFYTELLAGYAATGQAAVQELWSAERLVASRLMIRANGMLVMLKATYDESLAKYAIGWRLLEAALRHACADPAVSKVEFYTNAHHGQLPWASGTRTIRHLSYLREGPLGAALQGVQTLRLVLSANARIPAPKPPLSVTRHDLSEPWPKDVRSLFAQSGRDDLSASQGWYENLYRTMYASRPDAASTALWVLREGEHAVAAFPVRVTRERSGPQLRPLDGDRHTPLFVPPLAPNLKPETLAVLLREVARRYQGLASLAFSPMDPASDGAMRLHRALDLAGLLAFKYYCFTDWFLRAPATWGDYLAGRSDAQRSVIRRAGEAMADGKTRLEIVTSPADVERGLAAFWQVHDAGWRHSEPFPEFIDGLARGSAERGELRLGLIWREDRPVAAQLWLVTQGKATAYKHAYDESIRALEPDTWLSAVLLRHAIEQDRVREVEYMIGDERFRKIWMGESRERWGVVAFKPTSLAGLAGAVARRIIPARRGPRPTRLAAPPASPAPHAPKRRRRSRRPR